MGAAFLAVVTAPGTGFYPLHEARRIAAMTSTGEIPQLESFSNRVGGGEGKTARSVRAVVNFTTAMNGVAVRRTFVKLTKVDSP